MNWLRTAGVEDVALRKESVDRNNDTSRTKKINPAVALRKESVDRNGDNRLRRFTLDVALRKESVDRNDKSKRLKTEKRKSLSARRAWIEMSNYCERAGMLKGRSPQGERG